MPNRISTIIGIRFLTGSGKMLLLFDQYGQALLMPFYIMIPSQYEPFFGARIQIPAYTLIAGVAATLTQEPQAQHFGIYAHC